MHRQLQWLHWIGALMIIELVWCIALMIPIVLRFLRSPFGFFTYIGIFCQLQVAILSSQVTEAPGAERRVLEFLYFVTKEFV